MLRTPDLSGCALDGRYELHELIGEGAFGRVYKGLDRRLHRWVAVKVIKPWWAEDSAWVDRFQREAQLLARVSDPGIVQIFDIGHAEEGPYYVAELVGGESLSDRLLRGALSPEDARAVAEQLGRALGSAHEQGVVHCDVKPANVMLTPGGEVKIGDFGVARLAEGTSQAPSATIAGTPHYMSPEQARGRPTSPATDVYSTGVVLYEMLAGRPPFQSGSAVELGLCHVQDEPPPLPLRIPARLREIVTRALAKEPGSRYRDGVAMAAALHAAEVSAEVSDSPAGVTDHPDVAGSQGDLPSSSAEMPRSPAQAAGSFTAASGSTAVRRRLPRGGALDGTAATVMIGDPPTIDLGSANGDETARRTPGRSAPEQARALPPAYHDGARRRRRVALAAGLLALAACAVVVFLFTSARAKTTVPELRGLPSGGVRARAQRAHVHTAFSTRYAASAAGLAVAQRPAAGARVAEDSTVQVVLSAGPPPVEVPSVVGQSSSSAESLIANTGLRYAVTLIAAPGSTTGEVMHQTPSASTTVPSGSTVALSVAEAPRWRPLTSFSGVDDGHSVPFRIRGSEWRVNYSMSYRGTCLLILTCLGPSAEARNLEGESTFGGFELNEGSSQTHTFTSGPGLYTVDISGGQDSARWSMTVEDRY